MKDLSSEATKLFKHQKYLKNLMQHRTSSDSIGVRVAFYEEDVAHTSIQGLKHLIEQQKSHITINKENNR
ncbi:MAG: hypothetical protein H6766_00565 [Candidatus Peribacteria bacterium]|nr:MAG: hypothetical protein H6766_00565 [Candidatus Peribacteria bacterium]